MIDSLTFITPWLHVIFQVGITEAGDNQLMVVVNVSWKVYQLMSCISYYDMEYKKKKKKKRRKSLFNLEMRMMLYPYLEEKKMLIKQKVASCSRQFLSPKSENGKKKKLVGSWSSRWTFYCGKGTQFHR